MAGGEFEPETDLLSADHRVPMLSPARRLSSYSLPEGVNDHPSNTQTRSQGQSLRYGLSAALLHGRVLHNQYSSWFHYGFTPIGRARKGPRIPVGRRPAFQATG